MEGKLNCINTKNEVWKKLDTYREVKSQLNDTLHCWIQMNLKDVRRYNVTLWKIDDRLYFNSELNEAIAVILRQDTSTSARMDFVDMVYCKLINDKWLFFYRSMPGLTVRRHNAKIDPHNPYTFDELSKIAAREIVMGGYIDAKCNINDSYIHGWYTRNLINKHYYFLNSK